MSQTSLSRRRFLQSIAAAAAVGPFLSIPSRAAGARCCATPASARPVRRFATLIVVRQASGVRSRRRRRCRPLPVRAAAGAVPEGPRLPGLARAAQEGAREHRLGERVDPRSHALPRRARGDEARQAGLRPEAALQHAAGNAPAHRRSAPPQGPDDADGHPGVLEPSRSATAKRSCAAASSARSARSTRSRTRAGATTSRFRRRRSGAGAARLGRVAGRERARGRSRTACITRASGAGASDSAPARSATWAATSTARRIAR